jgi:hypothetical protein
MNPSLGLGANRVDRHHGGDGSGWTRMQVLAVGPTGQNPGNTPRSSSSSTPRAATGGV